MHHDIVEPQFRYCFSVWGGCSETKLQTCQLLQNQASRSITKVWAFALNNFRQASLLVSFHINYTWWQDWKTAPCKECILLLSYPTQRVDKSIPLIYILLWENCYDDDEYCINLLAGKYLFTIPMKGSVIYFYNSCLCSILVMSLGVYLPFVININFEQRNGAPRVIILCNKNLQFVLLTHWSIFTADISSKEREIKN